MLCPKCHHEVYVTDDRCMSCGHSLSVSRPSRPPTQGSARTLSVARPSGHHLIPKLVVAVIAASVIGGIWWHQKSQAEARTAAAQAAMAQGRRFYNAGQYTEAMGSFQKGQELGDESAAKSIQQCRIKIAQVEAAQQQAAAESEASRARADQFFAQAAQRSNQTQTEDTPSREVRSTGMAPGYKDRDFYINIAKRAVIQDLKAPRTAQFEGGGLRAIGVEIDRRDGHVLVHGEVDAQNGFGAMLS